MLILKLTVLVIYSELFLVKCVNYCEICVNHTICLFPTSGPGPFCTHYKSTFLTTDDINSIVSRINEKRNYVAMGLSSYFPQAANMRKVVWSNELAMFAQRWVDQCDQYTRQDREDYCRDLGDDVKVGQNIATVLGSTSGLNVKSFVDMWYMKSTKYTGSVIFYNQSRDLDTHYFTQLIWADTKFVGCGRAKFRITDRNTTADRLVCNFAPKGNIKGKPIYIIGYPATQCSPGSEIDSTFPGLCWYKNYGKEKLTQSPPVSSLLRILNLSNNSVTQEIDPIESNLKQVNNVSNRTSGQRYQRIRHVLPNKTHDGSKRIDLLGSQNVWKKLNNNSGHNIKMLYESEHGHSKIYHGNRAPIDNLDGVYTNVFKEYYTTEPIRMNLKEDLRKYNRNKNHCTRKMRFSNYFSVDASATDECQTYKYTGGKHLPSTHPCQTTLSYINEIVTETSHGLCPCIKQTTTSPSPCNFNVNYKCVSDICATVKCLKIKQENLLKPELNLYELPPHLAPKSGDFKDYPDSSSYHTRSFSVNTDDHLLEKSPYMKNNKKILQHKKLSDMSEFDYFNIYDFLHRKKQKKRDSIDQITFKPFWQDDQFNNKKPSDLRSMRYTTLMNKIKQKTRSTSTSTKSTMITEPITIKLKVSSVDKNERDHITERYLSFDELMHIRKMSTIEAERDGRRMNNEADTTPTTTVPTIDTPFIRKKHCTRKLTCTWTALTVTGNDGNAILPGGGDFGSRTPPGYVDGCTRTSTCTRDFQHRNIISTIPDPTSIEPSPEDEDYCEKRSLNIRKRDSFKKHKVENDFSSTENYLSGPILGLHDYNYKTTLPQLLFL